jgi:serine/threonine-protein kinase
MQPEGERPPLEPPEKHDEDEPFVTTGPTINTEGNLESAPEPVEPHRSSVLRPAAPAHAPQADLELASSRQAAPLELEARAPHPATDYVPPPAPKPVRASSGPSPWPLLLLLVLGIGGGYATYYFFFRAKGPPPRAAIALTITITSVPNGAAVSVEGTSVGSTPWAADNIWAEGPVNVSVTLPGYRPWTGTFPGGRPARLEARLQRR